MAPSLGRPSGRENAVSLSVIGALVLIAAGIGFRQARFNPAVSEYLKAAAVPAAASPAGTSRKFPSLVVFPAGLEPMSAPERFDRAGLSDKIDGRAELYLPAGFTSLACQRAGFRDDSGEWLEVFIYDMGSDRGAFSVFSIQKREGAPALPFVRHGYRTANSICLVRGREYVEVIASASGARIDETLDAIGRAMTTRAGKGAGGAELEEASLFPADGQVEGSVALITANAFGFGSLDNVFTARYRQGDSHVTLFISRRPSAEDAERLSQAYRGFLVRLGGEERGIGGVPDAWLLDVDGSFEGILASGPILAGVHEANSAETVEEWIGRLGRSLAGAGK